MSTNASQFERKNIRLPVASYQGRRPYFATLCFHNRIAFGKDPTVARCLIRKLKKHAAQCAFFVHAYCVMPDHVHILAMAADESSNLVKFVEAFKQETAIEFERRYGRRLWQFKYYDRVLRPSDPPDRVAWYIWLNPVRKGLCRAPTDYPFVGALTLVGGRLLRSVASAEWIPPWKMPR